MTDTIHMMDRDNNSTPLEKQMIRMKIKAQTARANLRTHMARIIPYLVKELDTFEESDAVSLFDNFDSLNSWFVELEELVNSARREVRDAEAALHILKVVKDEEK